MNNMHKKYKYLNYVPAPVHLESNMYDLVDDKEFCTPDGRTPLLISTQHGIFPTGFKGKKDYDQLKGLENQNVAFIGRGVYSENEYEHITEFFTNQDTLKKIRNKDITIILGSWGNGVINK
jgi:hypothetical protein